MEVKLGPEGHPEAWVMTNWMDRTATQAIAASRPSLLLRTMSESVILQQLGVFDNIHGLYCYQGPHGCLGSGSPPVVTMVTEGCTVGGSVTIWVA